MEAITTLAAKRKILLARAGELQLPKIVKMAFGNGGVDSDGNLIGLTEDQQNLNNEIYRKKIAMHEIVNDTQIRYICEIGEEELVGEKISELALVDEDEDLITIKHFTEKEKDNDFSFVFKVNDTM